MASGATMIETLPQRILGKTGVPVPILGLGTAPAGMGLPDDQAISLFHLSLDLGVTYLDTAPGYDRAQKQLGHVMKDRRDEAFLVTKTHTANAQKAIEILEQSLSDLQTDHVDMTFVHSVGSLSGDEILSKNGALAGLREAQKRGLTRFVGFTAHNRPAIAAQILKEADVDALMVAMNFVDRHTYKFETEVLPLATKQRAGVAAMKVFGGAPNMKYENPTGSILSQTETDDHELAFRYALGLPGVQVAVIGMYGEDELHQNVAWAKNYAPLNERELSQLCQAGEKVASVWGAHFGPVT
jgi:predicted aldo/keto reductase-like oxidoreductase